MSQNPEIIETFTCLSMIDLYKNLLEKKTIRKNNPEEQP